MQRAEHSRSVRRRVRGGWSLIEILIAMMCATVLASALYGLVQGSYNSQWELMNQNNSNLGSRQVVDYLADHLRGATAITGGSSTDVTFTDASNNTIHYYLYSSDNTLRVSKNGQGNGSSGTVLAYNVQSLNFTYWYWVTSTGLWSNVGLPADLTTIGAMDITATVSVNGYQRQLLSSVKLRYCKYP